VAWAILAWAGASLTPVAGAATDPPSQGPPQQAVAVLRTGVVWLDAGPIVLRGFGAGSTSLGTLTRGVPQIDASASAVALAGERGSEEGPEYATSSEFIGGVPPAALRAIPQPKPVRGGGCNHWQPASAGLADFVVAGEELIASGGGPCPAGVHPTRQPLFAKDLRGGRWHVLRWLAGDSPPMLAAEGETLAVGVQFSTATMEVFLINLRDGRTLARFNMPDGYLAFAAPNRLVLAQPEASRELNENHFPLGPRLHVAGTTISSGAGSGPFQLVLYSTSGRRLAQLGSSRELPLVSAMHIVTDEEENEQESLSVRSIPGGAPVPVVGYGGPARSLITFAFRWPALVAVETTSTPLAPAEITCKSGLYTPESQPFLAVFDLATPEPFLAPPPSTVAASSSLSCPPEVANP
jgi:hypothetical protein